MSEERKEEREGTGRERESERERAVKDGANDGTLRGG